MYTTRIGVTSTRTVKREHFVTDISKYYDQISREPLLTREEETDLFLLLRDEGLSQKERDKIRDRIIRANLRYPFKLAKSYSKGDPGTFEELIAAGNEGLVVAMEKFDPDRGFRFLSYAGFWCSQRILKQMASMRIVALPIYRQQLAARIQKAQSNTEGMTFEELKKEFPDVPEKDLKELSETRFLTFYIEDVGDDPALEIDPIATEVEVRIDRERIHAVIESLPSPHQEIIFMSYGMKDGREHTHAEIAKELGISKDQLREYKKEAFEMLREKLAHHAPADD
jgi:RNA polymerase sigma factor (sigma-70 family)